MGILISTKFYYFAINLEYLHFKIIYANVCDETQQCIFEIKLTRYYDK